jgi:hypothetical protein
MPKIEMTVTDAEARQIAEAQAAGIPVRVQIGDGPRARRDPISGTVFTPRSRAGNPRDLEEGFPGSGGKSAEDRREAAAIGIEAAYRQADEGDEFFEPAMHRVLASAKFIGGPFKKTIELPMESARVWKKHRTKRGVTPEDTVQVYWAVADQLFHGLLQNAEAFDRILDASGYALGGSGYEAETKFLTLSIEYFLEEQRWDTPAVYADMLMSMVSAGVSILLAYRVTGKYKTAYLLEALGHLAHAATVLHIFTERQRQDRGIPLPRGTKTVWETLVPAFDPNPYLRSSGEEA